MKRSVKLPSKGPMTLERDDSGRRGVLASLNRLVVASFARFAISNVQIQNKQQETLK